MEEEKVKKRGHGFLIFLVIVAILVGAFFGIKTLMEKQAQNQGKTSVITAITKAKPSVSAKQTLSGIDFYVTANDDYEVVEITYELYDSSGSVYSTGKVSGSNYKKGNTYTINKSLSLTEQLKTNKISYSVNYFR